MPAVARVGDPDSGGDLIVTGSSNVFVNGKAATRIGDIDNHPDGPETNVNGSSTVFVNGKAVVRVGDKDTHGPPHVIASGSPNVFAE